MQQASILKFFKAKPNAACDNQQKEQTTSPTKRPAEEEEKDQTPHKRQAVSPDGATPIKKDAAPLTPNTNSSFKPAALTSPIMDVKLVVRQKINSGSFALHENIGQSWFKALSSEFDKPYFKKLSAFVRDARKANRVFPPEEKVYTWTHFHDIKETRVVILGQDPYHGPNQAHGLCFSVQPGIRIPPSLVNIYKELEDDIPGFSSPPHGCLLGWTKQGVLLLNTCLTVNQGQANSHQNKGWETFTDAVIKWLSSNLKHNIVFILWGRPAQRKTSIINKRHLILTAVHPSPLSAHTGFFGCKHFSKTNAFLTAQGLPQIDWKDL